MSDLLCTAMARVGDLIAYMDADYKPEEIINIYGLRNADILVSEAQRLGFIKTDNLELTDRARRFLEALRPEEQEAIWQEAVEEVA